jgi:hypothetical protein
MTEEELIKKAMKLWPTNASKPVPGSIYIGTNDFQSAGKKQIRLRLDFAADGSVTKHDLSKPKRKKVRALSR